MCVGFDIVTAWQIRLLLTGIRYDIVASIIIVTVSNDRVVILFEVDQLIGTFGESVSVDFEGHVNPFVGTIDGQEGDRLLQIGIL